MRVLQQQELESITLKGKGRSSEAYNSIINLKENEALLIEKKDWKRKASPSSLVKYIEKTHSIKLSYAALADNSGWLVKRLNDTQKNNDIKPDVNTKTEVIIQQAKPILHHEIHEPITESFLKSELTIYYLGRISALKIEKIEDSIKAAQEHYRDESRVLIKTLFESIIETLAKHKHIIIENGKTYIPLKKH